MNVFWNPSDNAAMTGTDFKKSVVRNCDSDRHNESRALETLVNAAITFTNELPLGKDNKISCNALQMLWN